MPDMNRKYQVKRRGAIGRRVPLLIICGLILLASLLPSLFTPTVTTAAGSIAMTGTWASQILQIPQGSSVTSQSAHVTVFNPSGDSPITVNMNTIAPTGVTVSLSSSEFVVQPGSQRQVNVQQVFVSSDTVPGDYQVEIVANAFYEDAGGVQILPAVGQTADVTVRGESALVVVDIISPGGQPIWAVLRLFKMINGSQYEYAYSTTGHLETTVSPGHYRVEAYSNSGEPLAEPQEFDIGNGEEQRLTLTANVIYFESFAINPAYNTETGDLGFVQIVYTANNVYQAVPNAEVKLTVTLDGTPLEEISIFTLNPFNVGRVGVPYNYSPADGWHGGTYGFSLQLYVDGELYASTQEQTLQVGSSGALDWWIFVLAALGGGLLIGGIIMFFKRRRKSDKPEKAKKSRKHERKESTAEGETAGGMALGFKRLLSRRGKTAKKQAVPAKGTAAAGTGAVASTVAKKDVGTAAQTQQPHKAVPAVDTTKPSGEKPAGGQATAAGKESAAAQASTVAKPPAAQPAAAQAPKAAQPAPAHVKSAADLKKAIASRQSDGATPPLAATPGTQAKEAAPLKDHAAATVSAAPASTTAAPVATARRDPLTVPSPFAAPRQGPPIKKARFGKKGVVDGAAATSRPPMAPTAGTGPTQAQPSGETAAVKEGTATTTPETIEPLSVPSPFAAYRDKKPAEKPAPAVQDTAAESSEVAGAPVQEPASVPASAGGEEAEAPGETTVEAAATAPAPAIIEEEGSAESAEDKRDTAGAELHGDSKSEDQAAQAPQQGDDASKKFVSPIRFLNR